MGIYRRKNKDDEHYGPWYIKYPTGVDSITGKLKYTSRKVGSSKRVAELAFSKRMLEWQERKHLGLAKKKEYLFGEVVDWYLSLPRTNQIKSIYKIRQHCKILKDEFGSMKANEIKPSMIEAYQHKRLSAINYRGTQYKPASVNRELEVVRRIYNLAMREEMVDRNPCWKVTRLPEKNARDRVLSKEELDKLLKELPPHAADIVVLAYHTGMRAGEIFGLTWDRVNLREGFFTLSPKDTKTGEARHVYFNGPVREVLERLKKVRYISHNHVFTYQGKPVISIKNALANALKEAGINDFLFHDLRHTFVSNARKAGIDRTVIMKLTGHKTLSMFTRYNTVDQADAKDAMEKLDSLFNKEEQPSAAIVLQAQKRGQEKSPNPLISLAPRVGLEPTT
ncbi:MAG: site-specific integrase [Thermodesulfobacteriota bacterium]